MEGRYSGNEGDFYDTPEAADAELQRRIDQAIADLNFGPDQHELYPNQIVYGPGSYGWDEAGGWDRKEAEARAARAVKDAWNEEYGVAGPDYGLYPNPGSGNLYDLPSGGGVNPLMPGVPDDGQAPIQYPPGTNPPPVTPPVEPPPPITDKYGHSPDDKYYRLPDGSYPNMPVYNPTGPGGADGQGNTPYGTPPPPYQDYPGGGGGYGKGGAALTGFNPRTSVGQSGFGNQPAFGQAYGYAQQLPEIATVPNTAPSTGKGGTSPQQMGLPAMTYEQYMALTGQQQGTT